MALLWNGDLSTGDRYQYAGIEFGGTQDGTPPLDQRLVIAKSIDGYVAPPGIPGGYMMRMQVSPGDKYGGSSGWRFLIWKLPDAQAWIDAGYDSTIVWCGMWAPGWPGDSNIWLSGTEVHHTGGTVAPHHFAAFTDRMRTDIYGGSDTNKTTYLEHDFLYGYERGAWYVFVERYLHNHFPNGRYQLWWGKPGVDKTLKLEVDLANCATMYQGFRNYQLMGTYRAETGVGTNLFYWAGAREYSTSAEALAYATSILNGSAPDPPHPLKPPVNTLLPVVSGPLIVGGQLATTPGGWTEAPTSVTYQWQWQPVGSTSWGDVTGATKPTFEEADTFLGALIRVTVTASNADGTAVVNSEPVGPVAASAPAPGFKVTVKTQDSKTVTIQWTPPAGQEWYVPLIDGSDLMTDGKRHPGKSSTQSTVKIGKKLDGQKHAYGVEILDGIASGSVTV